MTPTPSTPSASSPDEHPEVAEISALHEGILPVERQEEIRSHLTSCEQCADVRASLDEIREVLGTLPGPAAMPEDVANRIDAALAAEALLDATAPDAAGVAGVANGTGGAHDTGGADTPEPRDGSAAPTMAAATPRGPSGEPDAVSRETARPAGAPDDPADTDDAGHAADDDPAGHVSRETHAADRPAGHPSGSTGPGRPASRTRGGRRSRRWRKATLIAAASVAVLGIGGITLQSLSNSGDVHTTSGSAADDGSAKSSRDSGDASEDRRMEKRVQSLLAHQGSSAPSESGSRPGSGQPSDSPTVDTKRSPSGDTTLRENRTGGAATAPSCVREGIDRTESPLAVDAEATYGGRSGYLVVLPHAGGDPRRVDAYVVDPSCVSADPSEPGKVLLKRTYPRG